MDTEFHASNLATCSLCHGSFSNDPATDHESICWNCNFLLQEDYDHNHFHSYRRRNRNRYGSSESINHLSSQQSDSTSHSGFGSPSLSFALSFSGYTTDSQLFGHEYEEGDDIDPMHAATAQWDDDREEDAIESIGSTDGAHNPVEANSFLKALLCVIITEEHENNGSGCAICKEGFRVGSEVKGLPCLHMYHEWCILPWLIARNSCPLCRYELPCESPCDFDVENDESISSIVSVSTGNLDRNDEGVKGKRWLLLPGSIVSIVLGVVIVVWLGRDPISVFKVRDTKKEPSTWLPWYFSQG